MPRPKELQNRFPLARKIFANPPQNCWLAIEQNEMRVVGKGKDATAALRAAIANGFQHPLLVRSPRYIV